MLVLSRADLERLLPPEVLIDALEQAFLAAAAGRAEAPPRAALTVDRDSVLLLMPALTRDAGGEPDDLGTKLVTFYAGNRARGQPTIQAAYLLMEGRTGRPLALLEGTVLTALRTGATSALAASRLARADARRVTCFGAGVQASFQLRCLAAVRDLEAVTVVGRDPVRARRFAETMSQVLGVPARVADDPRRAVSGSDVVVCATTSPVPVVFGRDLRPGTHLDLVGAFRPRDREADTEAVRRARVVVDTYAGAFEEAGDILIPLAEGAIGRDHVTAELAEVLGGRRPGRLGGDEITLFKSVGWAVEDLAAARLAWERARTEGAGTEVKL